MFSCSFEKRLIREIASLGGGAKTLARPKVLCVCVSKKAESYCMGTQFCVFALFSCSFLHSFDRLSFVSSVCVSSEGKVLTVLTSVGVGHIAL